MRGVAAVVLAAGASTRLGSPKQLVMLGEETLLERAIRAAREAGCSPVVVVLGADYEVIAANTYLGDAVPVVNEEWAQGMGSSVALGVRTVGLLSKGLDGLVLMVCDQPAVTVGHLQLLMKGTEVAASRYSGKNGVPAFFPAKCFEELTQLRGDVGARELLRAACYEELADGELDVDTEEDLTRVRALFG